MKYSDAKGNWDFGEAFNEKVADPVSPKNEFPFPLSQLILFVFIYFGVLSVFMVARASETNVAVNGLFDTIITILFIGVLPVMLLLCAWVAVKFWNFFQALVEKNSW